MRKSMRILYIVLFIVSCAIVYSSFYLHEESWNAIIVSIGCGGITSVIVTCLIDWRNQKNTKAEYKIKFEMILREYVDIYRRLVWTSVNECRGLYQSDETHTLQEWLLILSDETRYSKSKMLMQRRCERLSANLVNLQRYIENFQGQSATLILNGFPGIEKVLDFFKKQHLHAWSSLFQLETKNYKLFCDTTYILYKEFLDEFPQYKSEFPEKYGESLLSEWKTQ